MSSIENSLRMRRFKFGLQAFYSFGYHRFDSGKIRQLIIGINKEDMQLCIGRNGSI